MIDLIFPAGRKPDYEPPPVEKVVPTLDVSRSDYLYSRSRFDLIPHGDGTGTVLHASPVGLFISEEPVAMPPPRKGAPKPKPKPERNLRVGTVPPGLKGQDFAAYAVGQDYYLVTVPGQVFRASPNGPGKLSVSPVWDDTGKPVMGCVQDLDRKKVFVYGWDGGPGRKGRFVFELAREIEPHRYSRKAPGTGRPDDGVYETMDCLKALEKAFPPKK